MKILNQQFELTVLYRGENAAREYGLNNVTYLESRVGQNWHLRFKNNTPGRVLVIPSVDGLSTLTGKPATPEDDGYIVAPYSSVTITGWRVSLSETREFVFTERDASYVSEVPGVTNNSGVIGVAVFSEKPSDAFLEQLKTLKEEFGEFKKQQEQTRWVPYPVYQPPVYVQPAPVYPSWYTIWCGSGCPNNTEFVGAASNNVLTAGESIRTSLQHDVGCSTTEEMRQKIQEEFWLRAQTIAANAVPDASVFAHGTGYGKNLTDEVNEAKFERAEQIAVACLYYAPRAGLEKLGIDLHKTLEVSSGRPQAFGPRFCQIPTKHINK